MRAFRAVGGDPIFIQSGKGATMTDVDGKSYIDYVFSWGPLILGQPPGGGGGAGRASGNGNQLRGFDSRGRWNWRNAS